MDILGPTLSTSNKNQFMMVMKSQSWNFKRAVTKSNSIAFLIASLFMDRWVIIYRLPEYVLTDNGPNLSIGALSHYAPFRKINSMEL